MTTIVLDDLWRDLAASKPVMKPTCDEKGNWHYVPANQIDPGHRYANPKDQEPKK